MFFIFSNQKTIMIQLIKGDCLIKMQNIPDKNIDAIICDLPYGVLNKSNKNMEVEE